MKVPIYLDYNATTPVDQRVMERMIPYFTTHFGNASSKGHAFGWAAGEAVSLAREEVASSMKAAPSEIYFTGGATESINAAIKGVAKTYVKKGNHIVTARSEHKAVIETCQALEKQGIEVTYLGVDESGLIDLGELAESIRKDTILVSIMWANNETGVMQPIDEIAKISRSAGALFFSDATQAIGKVPVDIQNIDLLACTAHKIYGPKGVGALYVRRKDPRVKLLPLIHGGSQEKGLRGGTLNTPGIVGLGAAMHIATQELSTESDRLTGIRDEFEERLLASLSDIKINGYQAPRLPHVSNLTFAGLQSANLVTQLRELAVSTGSACSTGTGKPSHVLKAMGLSDTDALASLRISFGRFSSKEEMVFASKKIIEAVSSLRKNALVTNMS